MMLTRPRWWLLVLLTTAGLSAAAALVAGFVPSAADLADPLARPAALVRSVTGSTATLVQLTSDIHAKHGLITRQSRTVVDIADHLDALVAEADALGPLSTDLTARTGQLTGEIGPLPGLVDVLTGPAVRAAGVADRLGSSIDTVTAQLRDIDSGLSEVSAHLDPLAPRAAAIAETLRRIERDTGPLRPVGPVLGRLRLGR